MSAELILVMICVFVGVSALVAALFQWMQGQTVSRVEKRLCRWTANPLLQKSASNRPLLAEALKTKDDLLEQVWKQARGIRLLLEQAEISFTVTQMAAVSAVLGGLGLFIAVSFRMPMALWPVMAGAGMAAPWAWVLWRRKRRLKAFAAQMPEAMDMLARALRAGQSLAAGIGLVGKEMPPPLGKEFARVFEEQNLGLSLEESLRDLTDRVPNMDLKFFATAVILQKQTGGDLAEILEKIATLIRQRFQIYGQVQALTAEGRLSGVVLMILPIFLFFAMYYLNPDYVMVLFTDPLGKRMLLVGVTMQLIGALVIRKIVNIKV